MIITFGSINVDLVFDMETTPSAGQTLLANNFHMEPGGKGANQAVAAARAGAPVSMYGSIGNDNLREVAMAGLVSAGVDVTGVATSAAATGCASILTDKHGRNQIAVAGGANMLANTANIPDDSLNSGTILLLQMENDAAEVEALLRRAHEGGAFSILNLAPAIHLDPEILKLPSLLVVNEDEAQAVAGWLGCENEAGALSSALSTAVLTTLGARGSVYADGSRRHFVEAHSITPLDTTAAGDCFIGVLAASLHAADTIEVALERATTAAALCCTRKGSQRSIPFLDEIERELAKAA